MRVLLVILDGLGDRPWPALDDRTPLEAAATPTLDALAARGATGVLHSLGRGRAPGSELAHFVLFGYPEAWYPGRAVFEAAGSGVTLSHDEVVFRVLFSAVREQPDGTLVLEKHFAETDDDTCRALAALIAEFEHGGFEMRLTFTGDRQGILHVRGPGVSEEVTDCDPFFPERPIAAVRPLARAGDPRSAALTADAVTAYLRHAYATLSTHPLNADTDRRADFPLLKWTGRARELPSFSARTGMRGAIVASSTLFEGIAATLGMSYRHLPYASDWTDDMRARIAAAAGAFAEGADFVHVHTKAPDEAGHRKDPALKRDVIAALDAGLGELGELADEGTLVVVTGDHGTPSGTGLIHSGDAPPILIAGPGVPTDDVAAFSERACARGVLGHLDGADLMPTLLNLRGTVRYLGAKLSAEVGLHWPEEYERFTV